jgi:microsomal dipeptidase-like Zn-dependent dipeptidase
MNLRSADLGHPRTHPLRPWGLQTTNLLRVWLFCLLLLGQFAFAPLGYAAGSDDTDNTTATQWWMYTAQTAADIGNTTSSLNARIVDIKTDNLSPYPFTATYLQNTGTYAKTWWWDADVDETTLSQHLASRNARLTSLKAYDPGNGKILLSAAMIANAGADAKSWWYFVGASTEDIARLAQANNARVTSIQSYVSNGQTYYAVIMIANAGADAKQWWWFANTPISTLGKLITTNNARLLSLTYAGNGNVNVAMESCAGGCPQWWWSAGATYAQTLALAASNNAHIITVDSYPGCGGYCFNTIMIAGSSGSDHGAAPTKLRGYVDLHTHPLSNLAFGGKLIYGGVDIGSMLPADPDCNHNVTATSMNQALGHDGSTHGGYNLFSNGCGDDIRELVIHNIQTQNHAPDPPGDAEGAPDFNSWPLWNDVTHQKMWVDWIRRSYDNGQRVLVALAVNNKTLGDMVAGPGDYATDDASSADRQISAIKDFVGRHGDFMQVAYSSSDLQNIVRANKMAVIIGVEIDAIGNFYNSASNSQIAAEINRLYGEGVRYIFPIHVLDNAFGGTAVYSDLFNYSQWRETGHAWTLTCSKPSDMINYQFSTPPSMPLLLAAITKLGTTLPNLDTYPPCPSGTGQVNARGLTASGVYAIQQMMQHGMLIDIDHMSQLSMNEALQVGQCVPGGYPLNSGHSDIRQGPANERDPTAAQYTAIGALHGMAGIGSGNQNASRWTSLSIATLQAMGGHVAVAFGTDTDGLFAGMPPIVPRAQGTPATMLPGATNNQQHVFYRDAVNAIIDMYYDPGPGTSTALAWAGPTSRTKAPLAAGNPATMLPGGTNNQQHIFFRDSSGNIEHVYYDPSSGMHGPEVWGKNAAGDPATMLPGGTNNQQHIFFRDTGGNIQHVFYDPNSGMHGPEVWGKNAAGEPATMLPGGTNNQQHIFYRDSSGDIEHVYYDPNSGMHGPEVWGKNAAGDPATMTPGGTNNQQHIFFRDTDGNIEHVYYDQSSGLHGPEIWAGGTSDYLPPVVYGTSLAPSQAGPRIYDINYDGVAHYGMLPDFLLSVRNAPDGNDLVDNNLMYGAQYLYDTWGLAETQSKKVPESCPIRN